tara:strand:+ start:202 stop:819 length:618 start_codon:yes stop_codon:yes gene_type:complete
MAGYIGSKAVLLSTTAAEVSGDALITGNLKVATIQKTNGSAPTLADLSINHTGSIIQTVYAAGASSTKGFGSSTQYSSTTFTDIDGSTLNITPSSTSSKILILASNHVYAPNLSSNSWRGANINILRGSTIISDETGNYGAGALFVDNDDRIMWHSSRQIVDSPSTTSSINYKCQIATIYNSHIVYVNRDSYGSGGHLMAMEIAG